MFGIANVDGLAAALDAPEDRPLNVSWISDSLAVLPSGGPAPNPVRRLTSDRMRRLLAEASEKFDWVIIDTPPVALLPDANLLASMVDAALLVIGATKAPLAAIQQAILAIGRERILGVVLNRVEPMDVTTHYRGSYFYKEVAEQALPKDVQA
jgi:Mrp family chromosome partitioning ATPase